MGLFDWFTGANPAASVAEGVVDGILGNVDRLIRDFHLPPDQQLKFEQAMAQIKLDTMKMAIEDIGSARQMQATTRSRMPAILALLITLGFFSILGLMWAHPSEAISDPLLIMLGALGTAWTAVVTFYFGSSAGSANKDYLLLKATPPNK